jgi:hypothetical protein
MPHEALIRATALAAEAAERPTNAQNLAAVRRHLSEAQAALARLEERAGKDA